MIPQMSPFITPFTIVVPVILPTIVAVNVFGTSVKLVIMSPGGKPGITKVTAKNTKKAITKTIAFDMFD